MLQTLLTLYPFAWFCWALQVSWMRKRDLHILTSDIYTYTGDQRFSIVHPPDTDEWDLKIEFAQQRDSGIYECQVN